MAVPAKSRALPRLVDVALSGLPTWYNMHRTIGGVIDQFPPAEQLTEEQARTLVDALIRLWVAFNFLPTLPKKTPARVFYPVMLARMAEPAMLMEHGVNGIEFCYFNPANDKAISLKAYDVSKIRQTHPNAYRSWTPEDDERLLKLAESGVSTAELAHTFLRNKGAIRSRLKKLMGE